MMTIFKDLTHTYIWQKLNRVLNEQNQPGYGNSTALGLRENGARMMLHCPRDGKLVLRLEYGGGHILDSGYILEYYDHWMTTPSCIERVKRWLEKVKEL